MDNVQLNTQNPWPWLRSQYRKSLMKTTPEDGRAESGYRIRFSDLQRMHVRKLQCKLAQHAVHIAFGDSQAEEPGEWESDLQAFIQAVKDFKYMDATTHEVWDAFNLASERSYEDDIIRGAMARFPDDRLLMPAGGRKSSRDVLELCRGGSLNKATYRRVIVVLFASALLLGPMWLMILHNTLYTGLVSTTMFVIVFGLVMVPYLDNEKDVLSLTAAYAAVLVVFVGLTAESSTR